MKADLLEWYQANGCFFPFQDQPANRYKSHPPFTIEDFIPDSPILNSSVDSSNSDSRLLANKCKSLEELRKVVSNFTGCDLKKMAKNTVFSHGNPESNIMLVGEAPGANEDEQGIPFCGQSGKLLDNILIGIGSSREKVYITNTVFWRPPGNRRPTAEEINICRPFVEKHISLINPKIIIMVGSTSVESLLDKKLPMHQMKGKMYSYDNQYLEKAIQCSVIFHPAYLLRSQNKKKDMWLDLIKIKQMMNF